MHEKWKTKPVFKTHIIEFEKKTVMNQLQNLSFSHPEIMGPQSAATVWNIRQLCQKKCRDDDGDDPFFTSNDFALLLNPSKKKGDKKNGEVRICDEDFASRVQPQISVFLTLNAAIIVALFMDRSRSMDSGAFEIFGFPLSR